MRKTITTNFCLKTLTILLVFITIGLCLFSMPIQQSVANAASFTNCKVDDGRFSMTMTANARKQTSLPLDKRTVSKKIGETTKDITYYCFEWKDLHNLRFRFSSNIRGSTTEYTAFKFLLTNVQDDNLETEISEVAESANFVTLYQGSIAGNTFPQFDFYYYIDKQSDLSETPTRCKGNDFGLYKFDFVYTYRADDSNLVDISVGDIYVAVLPQDINTVEQTDLKILYSVSSSNKLMNVFNLYLSNDSYKYVNPKHIKWSVVGLDKLKVNYVLTDKMKTDNLAQYANYKTIWESLPEADISGANFLFNSNDIEGTWTVYCTITNNNGETKTLSVQNLSTLKKEKESYVWLILLIIGLALVLGGIISFIVIYKKNDKVW